MSTFQRGCLQPLANLDSKCPVFDPPVCIQLACPPLTTLWETPRTYKQCWLFSILKLPQNRTIHVAGVSGVSTGALTHGKNIFFLRNLLLGQINRFWDVEICMHGINLSSQAESFFAFHILLDYHKCVKNVCSYV